MCPDNGLAANVLGFLTYAQMLMHAIAHGACGDTVRESALNDDSGRKLFAPLGVLGVGKARDGW